MKTNRYPVLRVVATIYKVLGIIVTVLTVLGACSVPFMGGLPFNQAGSGREMIEFTRRLVIGLIILFYGGFSALFLYAAGGVLTILIDLEANTRATAAFLERSQGS